MTKNKNDNNEIKALYTPSKLEKLALEINQKVKEKEKSLNIFRRIFRFFFRRR